MAEEKSHAGSGYAILAPCQGASKSLKHITGLQVGAMTAQVKDGKIHTYKTTVKVAFGVED